MNSGCIQVRYQREVSTLCSQTTRNLSAAFQVCVWSLCSSSPPAGWLLGRVTSHFPDPAHHLVSWRQQSAVLLSFPSFLRPRCKSRCWLNTPAFFFLLPSFRKAYNLSFPPLLPVFTLTQRHKSGPCTCFVMCCKMLAIHILDMWDSDCPFHLSWDILSATIHSKANRHPSESHAAINQEPGVDWNGIGWGSLRCSLGSNTPWQHHIINITT